MGRKREPGLELEYDLTHRCWVKEDCVMPRKLREEMRCKNGTLERKFWVFEQRGDFAACMDISGLPWWLRWRGIHPYCGKPGFNSWIGKIPWRRAWQPTPVFLLGKYHGQRSLAGYITWCHKESDTTEWLSTANFLNCLFISELFIFIYLMTGISPDTGNTIVSKADKNPCYSLEM